MLASTTNGHGFEFSGLRMAYTTLMDGDLGLVQQADLNLGKVILPDLILNHSQEFA